MCFIISIVSLILSYNFFMSGNLIGGVGTLLVALFFYLFDDKKYTFCKEFKN